MNLKALASIGANLSLALALTSCATPSNDSVARAVQINEMPPLLVSREVSDFVVEAVDARRMDYVEGALAAQRGTTAVIRQYGLLMMQDQADLLNRLNALAMEKQIAVPTVLGRSKSEGLRDLQAESGAAFDRKFISMITIDHRRDVKEFTRATEFDDPQVRGFARAHLPLIQAHLDGIRIIEERQ